jgi:hypothetical protein
MGLRALSVCPGEMTSAFELPAHRCMQENPYSAFDLAA